MAGLWGIRKKVLVAWIALLTAVSLIPILSVSDARAKRVTVRLRVGDNFQAAVNRHPAGTRFIIASGIHRLQSVKPKNGMIFTGKPGAVMAGSRVLKSFNREGDLWVIGGQRQQGAVTQGRPQDTITQPGHQRDNFAEELFINGVRQRHVSSKSEVDPGEWFFDYSTDKIYIGSDPQGKRVETSVTDHAFYGPEVRDVVIQNLTIRHYANPAQTGAIHGRYTRNWTIRRVNVIYNHGVGVHLGLGSRLLFSRVASNGQLGLRGWGVSQDGKDYGSPMVIKHNEIARNRQLGYHPGWEGGAMKILHSKGTIFVNNWVHHNRGYGIWFDYNNHDVTIRSNLVANNTHAGILYEVSYGDTQIYWNKVRQNGTEAGSVGPSGTGILVSNSRDVRIFGNAVDGNKRGILLRMKDREGGPDGQLEVANVKVRNNDVRMSTGTTGFVDETGNPAYYTAKGNVFEGNSYRLDDRTAVRFSWDGRWAAYTWAQWQQKGNDVGGRLESFDTAPRLPEEAKGFRRKKYGVLKRSSGRSTRGSVVLTSGASN